jgi:hypothetical protein
MTARLSGGPGGCAVPVSVQPGKQSPALDGFIVVKMLYLSPLHEEKESPGEGPGRRHGQLFVQVKTFLYGFLFEIGNIGDPKGHRLAFLEGHFNTARKGFAPVIFKETLDLAHIYLHIPRPKHPRSEEGRNSEGKVSLHSFYSKILDVQNFDYFKYTSSPHFLQLAFARNLAGAWLLVAVPSQTLPNIHGLAVN